MQSDTTVVSIAAAIAAIIIAAYGQKALHWHGTIWYVQLYFWGNKLDIK